MVHFCSYIYSLSTFVYEKFEDIKGLIRSRKSKTGQTIQNTVVHEKFEDTEGISETENR